MKELDKLIERLKKEYGENGVYAILRDKKNRLSIKDKHFEAVNDIIYFLWGLNATNYIDDETRKKIFNEILNS